MKSYMIILSIFILLNITISCTTEKADDTAVVQMSSLFEKIVVPTPPMGWNSFDAYDCAINEEQFRATVDYMAENLLEYGWEYAVIDYIWWHPEPGNWDTPRRFGHPNIRYKENGEPLHSEYTNMDEYGRLLPAVERFPSASGGQGFKPIADYVHNKGLKFGIHIMRGIHRGAYYYNKPILGSMATAKDIGEPWDTCPWCNHMFGVDATKEGAQEYYNSLFKLYAEWGVDYIKADDMQVPPFHKAELEIIRKAIDQCGRPMVLSLSPGEAPLSQAKHLIKNANLWRISADFWDDWEKIVHNFDLLNAWSPHIQANHWPDADMLPIGHISLGGRPHGPDRQSKFTWPEHYTLMTLWCIARSPLMMGGDLLSSSEQSLSFLKNKEVLNVNQNSINNRQIYKRNNKACWLADIPNSKNKYLALFNIGNHRDKVEFNFEWEMLRGEYKVRDLWAQTELGVFKEKFEIELDPHGAGMYKLTKTN
jgi:hypothetical protein